MAQVLVPPQHLNKTPWVNSSMKPLLPSLAVALELLVPLAEISQAAIRKRRSGKYTLELRLVKSN